MVSKEVLIEKCLDLKKKVDWITDINSTYYICVKWDYDYFVYLSDLLKLAVECFDKHYEDIEPDVLDMREKIFDLSMKQELHPFNVYEDYISELCRALDNFLIEHDENYDRWS